MSNNKSSVEWLWDKFVNESIKISHLVKLLEQAKAMHKEEIINAWRKGDGVYDKVSKQMSVQYYNQTYVDNNEME